MRNRVKAEFVDGACGWCQGRVLRGYKGKRGYQKCLRCHRVSWQGTRREQALQKRTAVEANKEALEELG